MVSYDIYEGHFAFKNELRSKLIPFSNWRESDDCIYYTPLAELVENGFAEEKDGMCLVPFLSIYQISEEERRILDVPSPLTDKLRLKADGTLDAPDFKYKINYVSSTGDFHKYNRRGNILLNETERFLLSPEQYALIEKVEEYNQLSTEEKSKTNNLLYFSQIKYLANKSGCKIDSYLEGENVYTPENIKLRVDINDDGLNIIPSIEHQESQKFESAFTHVADSRNIYPIQSNDGNRTIILFNEDQKNGLQEIKNNSGVRHTKDELRKIIKNPTEYFDPEIFDLDEFFSERVIEYGLYKPRFYPFVCPYKSCWIVGAKVEDPTNGTTKISFEDESELEEFESLIEEADNLNSDIVHYNGADIDIEDAKALANLAHKQFQSPDEPVDDECQGKKVLIIEENAESLGYSADTNIPEVEDKYVLYKNEYLNHAFTLKQHQEWGIAWMQYLITNHASGCLMADDMGLGKTLQILYFIDWHARSHPEHRPYLIVAPVSLLENWDSEYKKFISEPRMKITTITSSDITRKFNKEAIMKIQNMDIVLTNYETMRNAQLNFCAVDFEIAVLDEAQKIKTPGTLVTNAAKALKANFKVALTGTPVENSLLDLWCIMDFCVPGLLGNAREFAAKYQAPLKKEDTDLDLQGKQIREEIGQFLIRRMKADVAKDLPTKIERHEKMNMPYVQQKSYNGVVRRYNEGLTSGMLETINQMREVSEHPYLHNHTLTEHDSQDVIESSARLITTISLLDEIKQKGEKVIIFAERKDIQRMLQRIIKEKYGIYASIINGDTPTTTQQSRSSYYTIGDFERKLSRQKTIDNYQKTIGFNVIIMSPVAAGMGLNVTAANHVIHYSRHWNPAKENQATDRAYRIGQSKDVYVYYPMAISQIYKSFDETLDELLSRKSHLASSTIYPSAQMEVTKDDLYEELLKA